MNERLKSVLEEVLDESFETISSAGNFRDADFWDSLKYITLVVTLESKFEIKLAKEEVQQLMSVTGIESVLKRHGIEV